MTTTPTTITIADPTDALAETIFSTQLEIVENFEDPFELVREFLSNSADSNASNVTIEFVRGNDHLITFIYEDDGEGLKAYTDADGVHHNRLEYFFLLGKSDKRGSPNKIGKKGFGSKIALLSDNVKVSSRYIADDGTTAEVTADLIAPYTKLRNRQLVQASVTPGSANLNPAYRTGTRIEITNFHATKEDQFTKIALLKEYIHWFTAGGTVLPLVRSAASTMNIAIKDWTGALSFRGVHNPPADTDPTTLPYSAFPMRDKKSIDGMEVILRSNQYAQRVTFPSSTVQLIHEGQVCTIEVAAWILGSSKKDEFASDTFMPDRDRFGVWLAQGGILVQRHYSWVTSSPLDCNFHVIVNCDQFELNADRTRIKGKNNKLYIRVKDEFEAKFKQAILEAHKAFRNLKAVEDAAIAELETQKANRDRVNDINNRTNWDCQVPIGLENEPKTELEACGALCVLMANHPNELPFKLLDLSPRGTDAVVSVVDPTTGIARPTMYEVEMSLSNFLRHGHSPDSANGIVCWTNDMPLKRKVKTLKGITGSFNPTSQMLEIFTEKVTATDIKKGVATPRKCIPVFVLNDVFSRLEERLVQTPSTTGP